MIEERHCTYIWSTHVRRKAHHLYLINTWLKKGSTLTFIQAGTRPTTMMKGLTLISDHEGTHPNNHIRMAPSPRLSCLVTDQVPPFLEWQLPLHLSCSTEWPALISDMEGTNPLTMTDWLSITFDHGRNQSSHHVKMAMGLITFSWRKPRSGEHQASPWSTQTSLCLMASSTNQLSIPPLQHIGASLLLSAPYPWYSDARSWCASTCHGTLDSLTTSCNSGCHNVYK